MRRAALGLALFAIAAGGPSSCRCSRAPGNLDGGSGARVSTLRIAVPERLPNLDPAFATDVASAEQLGNVYEGLLQYHYLKRPYALVPALAEAMPETSADGLTYTVRLRKGVLFQDDPCFAESRGRGRELVAEDVVYSIRRLSDPKLAAPAGWALAGRLAETRAVDRYTLQFRLTRRFAQFPFLLAMPATFVVPREAVEAYGAQFALHPVGTGPYRLAEAEPATHWTWTRNPTYRADAYPAEGEPGDRETGLLEDAGKPLPRNDRIVVTVSTNPKALWESFLAGGQELSPLPTGRADLERAMAPNKELVGQLRARGLRLHKHVALETSRISLNMSDPRLGANRSLRQALSLAFDSAAYIDVFRNGFGMPAQSPLPPGIPGYDPAFRDPYRQYNLARARDLLAKAGFPDGKGLPPLEYAVPAVGNHAAQAEFAERAFGAIGVRLHVVPYRWPDFVATIRAKGAQLFASTWTADYPDAQDFLQLFVARNASPGPNDANYANPEYERLYERALELPDGSERATLYRRMIAIVTEDCPWIPIEHPIVATVAQPWLRNYKPHDLERAAWKYLRVDTPPERK